MSSRNKLSVVRARTVALVRSWGRTRTPTAQEYWGQGTGATVHWWKAL